MILWVQCRLGIESLRILKSIRRPINTHNLPINFRPWVYQRGSLVIALVRRSVSPYVRQSVFKYVRDCPLVFSNLKPGNHNDTKVTEPDFQKRLGGHKLGKNHFRGICCVFCSYLCIQSLKFSAISLSSSLSNAQRKQHVQEKSGSCCIVGARPLFLRLIFSAFGVFFTLWGHKWGKTPIFGAFVVFFVRISASRYENFLQFH